MNFATSSGLAFASGINAYLPLFALGLTATLWPESYQINPQFAFLTQIWVLVILGILTLADFFADKIPGLDHVWDTIHTVLRPIAGAMVAAAASPEAVDGWLAIILAAGAGLAGVTHVTKAATRATSTATTGGCMNTIISVVEDVLVFIGVVLSFLAPILMLGIVILFVTGFLILLPKVIKILRGRWKRTRNIGPPPSYIVPPGS